jgi:hypothetical protein
MNTTGTGGIPRFIYLARILNLCLFPVATVVLGDLVILYVPQAQEALLAFDDAAGRWYITSQAFAFEVAYLLWMICAWYVARLLVGKRFEPDLVGACASPTFAAGVSKHLPRLLALLAGLPIIYYLLKRQMLGLGLLSLGSCIAVILGLVFRRDWNRRGQREWIGYWSRKASEDIERFDSLARGAQLFIAALFVLSFGIWLALPVWMTPLARWIGAPALVLLALMSWTLFGGFALTYFPKTVHLPAFAWIAVLALFVSSRWNENHLVAPPQPGISNTPRLELGAAFVDWLRHRPDARAPVIFVSSYGGASRAAYWTTSALGKLEDEARGRHQSFADNIFVISGISGGSLGAAAFVTSLDLVRKAPTASCSKVRDVADGFTGLDHLSTIIGLMLFPDLLQRFLPPPVRQWDRSRGLEETWAYDWQNILTHCGMPAASNPWNRAFTSLYSTTAATPRLPALALSSTALGSGQAVFQTTFLLQRSDAFDILDPRLATQSLTLAQAVHNSARFPYISPAGVVRFAANQTTWDRLGDGGYVEASGTLTLSEIIETLRSAGLIHSAGSPGDCSMSAPASGCYILEDQVRVLILDNFPTYGGNLLCGAPLPGKPGERIAQPQNPLLEQPRPLPPGADFLAPLFGAFSTNTGRAVTAQVDLGVLAGGCTARFAELRLPAAAAGSQDPSMDWMLNAQSRHDIDSVLDGAATNALYSQVVSPRVLLQQNLDIVRGWFFAPSVTVPESQATLGMSVTTVHVAKAGVAH